MASQEHSQGRQNNGGSPSSQAQDVAKKVQDGVSQAGDRLREGLDSAKEQALHGYRQAEGAVARNPASSILVGFGVGFGLGVLLTVFLTPKKEEPWYDNYVPDSLRDIPDRFRDVSNRARKKAHKAESAARHIPESMGQYIPESVSRYIPESVARYIPGL